MPIQALSFDLDGTLVDTAPEISEAVNRLLAEFRLPALSQELITRQIGAGIEVLLERVVDELRFIDPAGVARIPFARLMQRLRVHYDATAGSRVCAYPGAAAALAALKSNGVRLACLTNKDSGYAQRVLRNNGLDEFFELLVGGDSLPVRKPDAGAVRHVLEAFGVAAGEFVHVGDSTTDVAAARNAGVASWVLPHGYNSGVPIRLAKPDRIFDSLAALAAHVLGSRRVPIAEIAEGAAAG
jgi:phosphoglycolate phosphatase